MSTEQVTLNALALDALKDIHAGWKYIRSSHGDLYGVGWDRAQEKAERAIAALEAAQAQPVAVELPVVAQPPFGSKRKAAMAIYTAPFRFDRGYIFDSIGHMVADQDGINGDVEKSVIARVRGWGRIGYMPNPEELQDEVGQMLADALTDYYAQAAIAAQGNAQEQNTVLFVEGTAQVDSCKWRDTEEFYESECGEAWCFESGGPKENSVRFCQGCGKPVELMAPERPIYD